MKKGKRGQGLSVNAIILIVLGVIVLGVLVLGFTMGWSNFSSYFSTNNVQSIVTACSAACATQSVYDFCSVERTLKTSDIYNGDKVTCNILANLKGDESNEGSAKYKELNPTKTGLPNYNSFGVSCGVKLCS
ncbi:hypothetical protein HY448_02180 [Candidatus Pacearchaeota archaeon]|nr:hypothetical protein [Candidatus Pacearchaeota archaeon]